MTWYEVSSPAMAGDVSTAASSAFLEFCKPRLLQLSDLSAHVWVISLPDSSDFIEPFWAILAPDERLRAAQFHRRSDGTHYVSAHAALRIILAHYAEIDPRHLRFVLGRHGKPEIDRNLELPDIRFNLSHSGNLAAIAVTQGSDIGIDIERFEPRRANMAIAERFFSSREAAELMALPERKRAIGFFNCWTRKEAYIKGRGEGLSLPLSDFDVSLVPGVPPELLDSRIDPSDPIQWRLYDAPVENGYVACVAEKSSRNQSPDERSS